MDQEQQAPETTNAPSVAPAPDAPAQSQAPAQNTSQPAAAPAQDEPKRADPKDRHSTIREAMIARGVIKPANDNETRLAEAAQRARDQKTGQFVAGKQAAPKVALTTPAVPASTQAPLVAPLPRSLKKELEAHWKAAHPELQKAYAQRDADYERGIAQYRTQAEQAQALLSEFKPYERIMNMTGGNPQSALRSILPTMAVLTTGSPAEKAFVVARTLQQYGIPLEHIQQAMQGGVNGVQAPQMDPAYQSLAQQVQSLTQAWQGHQQRTQQAEDTRLNAIADSFGKDKPHFDSLRPQMWSLLQAQATAEAQGLQGPLGESATTAGWSEQQWIENAYTASLRLNPALYESELQRQREEAARAERDRATQAARASAAAAVQVRGAPAPVAGTAQVDVKDRRSVIAAALRSRMN